MIKEISTYVQYSFYYNHLMHTFAALVYLGLTWLWKENGLRVTDFLTKDVIASKNSPLRC